MAFRFALDSVLKHRKRLEEMAQRELAEAQLAVDACLNRLDEMYQRIDEVRVEIGQAIKAGTPEKIALAGQMEGFLVGQKTRIVALREEARELLQFAELKQDALVQAAQEKKILVKLRERRLNEYREWLAQIETKELDDQTVTRQAWRKR